MRRRGRRHLPKAPGRAPEVSWELEHSPYTPAGQVEMFERLARGMPSASPRRRLAMRLFILIYFVPFFVGLVVFAVTALVHVL